MGDAPLGTYKFDGEFTPLDQFLVSAGLLSPRQTPHLVPSSVRVHAPKSVTNSTGKKIDILTRGSTPISFDPKKKRGASDHLPLIAELELP
jgi:hypothetical protein